jgi:hypothetical protein
MATSYSQASVPRNPGNDIGNIIATGGGAEDGTSDNSK